MIAVNVVAFLAFAVDFFLCQRFPGLEDAAANSLILDVFPIAGGAVGMLLALFVFTGLGRGRRMNKHNVAWWFLAFVCLMAWGVVVAVRYGHVALDVSIDGVLTGWNLSRLGILGIYLLAVSAVAFCLFAWDKRVAARGRGGRRIPEARLLGLCLAGGSVGGLLAMWAFRHKTKKWYFVWGLPFFVVLHVVMLLLTHMTGII